MTVKEKVAERIKKLDEEEGQDWSNGTDTLIETVTSIVKEHIEELVSELHSLDKIGVSWDRRHLEIYEHYHSSDYIRASELNELIERFK